MYIGNFKILIYYMYIGYFKILIYCMNSQIYLVIMSVNIVSGYFVITLKVQGILILFLSIKAIKNI